MIISDAKNRAWIIICTVVLVIATLCYVWSVRHSPNGPSGGSVPGLIFGILGSLMMVFAALLGARKLVPSARFGSAQFWLRGHIWLGLLSVPFILFHSGFGWGGLVENLLWIAFAIVVFTGLFGLVVQNILPRVMTESVPLATFVEQIPFLNRRFQAESDCIVSQVCGRLDVPFEPIRDAVYEFAKSPGAGKLQLGKKSRQDDFEKKYLPAVYAGIEAPEKERPKPKGKGGASPTSEASQTGDSKKPAASATGGKSVLEQARAAAKPASSGAKAAKPDTKSILEQARNGGAKKTAGVGKPKDTSAILEQARAAAKAKASGETAEQPAEPAAKSILEQARAAGAATKKPSEKPTDTQSILEKARAAGGATKVVKEPAAEKASKPDTASILEKARAAAAKKESAQAKPPATGKKPDTATILQQTRAANAKATADAPPMSSVARSVPASSKPAAASRPVPPVVPKKKATPLPPQQVEELKHFYLSSVRPFLASQGDLDSPLASSAQSRRMFEHMQDVLVEPLRAVLDRLEEFCEQQRQFKVQQQLHRWLHCWLIIHIPVSMALMLLFVVHVIMALRVIPFSL